MNPLCIPGDAHRPVDAYSAYGNHAAVDQTLPSPASAPSTSTAPSTSSRQTDTQSNSSTTRSSQPVEELRGYSRPKRPRYYAELQKASQIADPYSPSEKSSSSSPLSSPNYQGKAARRKSVFASSSGSQNHSSGLSEPPLTASSLPEPDPRAPSRQGTRKLLKKRQLSLQFDPPAAKKDIIAMCKTMGRNLSRRKGSEK